ncbi:PREDICTED: egg cell-secreted protein 1.1-like [Populus euphratica]|uniref:Egg cell-secreted protein 1.1-like n=1 Tax=Populus euphratica TaxID=75702 RepID=A0AAJ6T7Z3_POPEU|nr:PREDICTED: egg cell-secreted protein 1.1-like [Populus euphratica]
MAFNLKLSLFFAFLACSSLDCYKARALPSASASNLMARLKLDGHSQNCWGSLVQLQACSGEIILFFLNGEAQLGRSCCQALRTIGEHCWPNMIDTLGFTAEEGQILEGYCDKAADPTTPSPPAPSVMPAKVVPKQN